MEREMATSWIKDREELAEVISCMTYGELLSVAHELHEMNAGENEGLRSKDRYGMAGTLFDWAEAVMEEKAAREETEKRAKAAQIKAA